MLVTITLSLKCKTGEDQLVECSTTLNCSSNGTMMSATECCVDSSGGLAYTIPGEGDECHACIGTYFWPVFIIITMENSVYYSHYSAWSLSAPPTFHLPFPYCSANNLHNILCAFSIST